MPATITRRTRRPPVLSVVEFRSGRGDHRVMIDWTHVTAALFDLDGVLTPTAKVHEAAWARMFNGFLERREGPGFEPFTEEDYLRYVDGKPRYEGVQSFLESRGIDLPHGDPGDPPGDGSVCALGNAKNDMFNAVLESEGVEPYADGVALLDALESLPVRLAVVSSSANAVAVLEAAGLKSRFEFIMDGRVARERAIAGKPQPDTFLAAAGELGASAATSVVFEDAVSGVAAGRAGAFAVVVGVDRTGSEKELLEAGADIVVSDLASLIG
jgi:beta-phosphoglucomutase family hydrolase